MVKKPVPDWLNSSLWYPSPSSAVRPSSSATNDAVSSSEYASAQTDHPPETVPVPVSPPSAVSAESPEVEIRDPLSDDSDNGGSVSPTPTAEDISRQAQILQEVSVDLFLSLCISALNLCFCGHSLVLILFGGVFLYSISCFI